MTAQEAPGLEAVRGRIAESSPDHVLAEALAHAHRVAELGTFITIGDEIKGDSGPLAGVPIAVKDNLDTDDFPTSGGTLALKASRPGRDHHAVERLRAAGAAVIGKTNMHELALGITSNNAAFGPVRNPHDPSRSPGGSSGGSAVAVATGVVPIALGTDTGGSMRVPASHCGVVGWRPTVGRWGSDRVVPISSTRDTTGVFATCVADVQMVDEIVTGLPARELGSERIRLGVPRRGFYDGLHPEVKDAAELVLDQLADAGVELVEMEVADAHPLDGECGFPIVFYELARDLPAYLATLRGPERDLTFADVLAEVASPDVRGAMEFSASGAVSDEAYRQALEARQRLQEAYRLALSPTDGVPLDALIYPTVPLPAPPIGDDDTTELNGEQVPVFLTTISNTGPGSTAGMPAISLPAGRTESGLPIGISLEAFSGDDDLLLAVARKVEAVIREG